MLTLTLSPKHIRTHDRAPNPNQPTSDICHSIDRDIDSIDKTTSIIICDRNSEDCPNLACMYCLTSGCWVHGVN